MHISFVQNIYTLSEKYMVGSYFNNLAFSVKANHFFDEWTGKYIDFIWTSSNFSPDFT